MIDRKTNKERRTAKWEGALVRQGWGLVGECCNGTKRQSKGVGTQCDREGEMPESCVVLRRCSCMVSLQCEKKRSADGTRFGGQRVFVFALPSQRRGGSGRLPLVVEAGAASSLPLAVKAGTAGSLLVAKASYCSPSLAHSRMTAIGRASSKFPSGSISQCHGHGLMAAGRSGSSLLGAGAAASLSSGNPHSFPSSSSEPAVLPPAMEGIGRVLCARPRQQQSTIPYL
ncbi:UNVERIFIED_CONTAM: hypothetical protein FKN15_059832 [Acipenser sinensis]